jgi:hypothetical protein
VRSALDRGFTRVEDLRALKTESSGEPPAVRSQGIADTTYHVADRVLTVSLLDAALPGTRIRVLLQRDGAWAKIGEASAGGLAEITLPVAGLAEIDGRTKLLELRGAILRVELVAADGSVEVLPRLDHVGDGGFHLLRGGEIGFELASSLPSGARRVVMISSNRVSSFIIPPPCA